MPSFLSLFSSSKRRRKLSQVIPGGEADVAHRGSDEDRGNLLSKNLKLQEQLREAEESEKHLRERVGQLEDQVTKLSEHNSTLDQERALAESNYQQLHIQHLDNLSLLQSRTIELNSANTFLRTNDEHSGQEILQSFQDINTNIAQVIANIADTFEYTAHSSKSNFGAPLTPPPYLNQSFISLLKTRNHSDDATLVHYALQSCFTYYIGQLMSSFCVGLEPDVDRFLEDLFQIIQSSDSQAIAGRWRVLSHMYSREYLARRGRRTSVTSHILADFDTILALSGSNRPLVAHYRENIQDVESAATKWCITVKESTISKSYYIILPKPDSKFDSGTMQDIFGNTQNQSQSPVWCTFALGLGFSVSTRSREVDGDVLQTRSVLGAQVVQKDSMLQLLEP